jgi:predicted nicotinamide N-methyase
VVSIDNIECWERPIFSLVSNPFLFSATVVAIEHSISDLSISSSPSDLQKMEFSFSRLIAACTAADVGNRSAAIVSHKKSNINNNNIDDDDCRVMLLEKIGGFLEGFGHVTWDAAFILACYILLEQDVGVMFQNANVVEVGSGTGFCGLACACCYRLKVRSVTLTDLEQTLRLTDANVEANRSTIERNHNLTLRTIPLHWGNEQQMKRVRDEIQSSSSSSSSSSTAHSTSNADIILCADCVYDDELFDALIQTLSVLCGDQGMVLLSARPRYGCNFELFQQKLSQRFNGMEQLHFKSSIGQRLIRTTTIAIAKQATVPKLWKLTKQRILKEQ